MRARALAPLVAAALLVGACSDDGPSGPTTSTSTPDATGSTRPSGASTLDGLLDTTEVATLDAPTALAARAGTDDLYVTEKSGTVRRIAVTEPTVDDGPPTYRTVAAPVLDLSDDIVDDGERGLLGLAFSSDGRRLYVFATMAPSGRSSLAAYDMGDGGAAVASSRRELLSLDRKYPNHNGGQLALGPDGYLYVGIGDGGGGGDPDHHGQDTGTLFGKVLRIDPEGGTGAGTGAGKAYGIPAGNPFADDGGRPEIWLSGVRNPWRFSFDRANGDLWVGDVGQDEWEEVDRLPAADGRDAGRGANLGWNRREGSHRYSGTNPKDGVLPVYEYRHEDGACSITGGYVYRGAAIPALQGQYLFSDYCSGGLEAVPAAEAATGPVARSTDLGLPLEQVQSFGEDADGEAYVLLASGPVLRLVSTG